ncbi:MAG: phosphotransferase [Alphaproteobacteria bacterium]|nr:phosphotransferase [Alphaproteobacteria bacterium]
MPDEPEVPARLGDILDAHRFDLSSLHAFLKANLEGFSGPLSVQQFQGGASNPTFLLSVGDEAGSLRRYVLRKRPPGALLESAHQVDREYHIMAALWQTEVPVPRVRILCEDASVIGTSFYVMDYVDGEIVTDPGLPERSSEARARMHGSFLQTLVALHAVDYMKVGLGQLQRRGDYLQRQLSRFTRQYRASEDNTIPAMEELIVLLPQSLPADRREAIVHGDYKFGNVMFDRSSHQVCAVLDWELTTIGDPLADLAFSALNWYGGIAGRGGLDVAAQPRGIPSVDAYVTEYCRATGRDRIRGWNFYLAFSLFRLASIMQGVYRRVLDGSVASRFDATNMAPALAQQALHLFENVPSEIGG